MVQTSAGTSGSAVVGYRLTSRKWWNLLSAAGSKPMKQTKRKTPAPKQRTQESMRLLVAALDTSNLASGRRRSTGDRPAALVTVKMTPMKMSWRCVTSNLVLMLAVVEALSKKLDRTVPFYYITKISVIHKVDFDRDCHSSKRSRINWHILMDLSTVTGCMNLAVSIKTLFAVTFAY